MPKVSNSPGRIQEVTPFKNNAHSLKRNQACHQCRKRKLKCDAKRPCSTCVRSHTYAHAHASPTDRLSLPEHPDCTFDDVSTAPPPQQLPPAPKSRYEKLESRINELESLLRDKTSPSSPSGSSQSSSQVNDAYATTNPNDFGVLPVLESQSASSNDVDSGNWSNLYFGSAENGNHTFATSGSLDHLAGIASLLSASPPAPPAQEPANAYTPPSSDAHSAQYSASPPADIDGGIADQGFSVVQSPSSYAMVYVSWPANLPDIATTRHLVHAFFTHHIHATRMFHTPSFLASLDLHPTDPQFPCKAILHAICAVGSLYASSLSPQVAITDSYPYDSATGIRRKGKKRISTFGDRQAKFAKEAIEEAFETGDKLFENAQAQMILTWFYQSHARWVEACLSASMAMRATIPCGMNVCPPFHGITGADPFSDRQVSILPHARTVIEDETRRNTFWIAYAMERQIAAGNSWSMLMDDKDVAQLLPLRHDQFLKGDLVLPPDRQWSHGKDTLYIHPEEQIKNFNMRYKSLVYSGDPSVIPIADTGIDMGPLKGSPRTTPLFLELDNLILTFKNKAPAYLKNPFADGQLDHYLFSTWNAIHLAQIHLHEPYSRPGSQSCLSAFKILTACRAIVNLLHTLSSTSFDVSLLDIYPFTSWFMAGRVLVRFLKAAQDAQAQDQILTLKTEIAFLHAMLAKAGERIPIAYTFSQMLESTAISTCGDLDTEEQHFHSREVAQIAQEFDFTATFFSYHTPPLAPEITKEQAMVVSQHTAMDPLPIMRS